MPINAPELIPETYLKYYPEESYIARNLAPEKYPTISLEALAAAQKKAEKAGVLSPEVGKYMLANALVEGGKRASDMGVNGIDEHAPPGSTVRKIIDTMGFSGEAAASTARAKQWNQFNATTGGLPGVSTTKQNEDPNRAAVQPKQDNPQTGMTIEDVRYNALLAATILAIKQARSKAAGDGSAEDTIRRWNGAGKGAENHLQKVQRTMEMLSHPKNAAILNFYRNALEQAP